MNRLTGKHILILSPQAWGVTRISKHHYAAQLAARGNRVTFLAPSPAGTRAPWLQVEQVPEHPGLELLPYTAPFPRWLKFKLPRLYDRLMALEARRILRALRVAKIDIVWDFVSAHLFSNLRVFPADLYVYHPVDAVARAGTKGADVVFSVADMILRKVGDGRIPQRLVNHGLCDAFARPARAHLSRAPADAQADPARPLRVGYAGNLMVHAIDRVQLRAVIEGHPEVSFHFWGPTSGSSNLGGATPASLAFVSFLRSRPNVTLHGAVTQEELALALAAMDALLLCYDAQKDPNGASNSHKILEYLSTGRPVISTYIAHYSRFPGLLEMLPTPQNEGFAAHFAVALQRLHHSGSDAARRRRIEFALSQTYECQLDRIVDVLNELRPAALTAAV